MDVIVDLQGFWKPTNVFVHFTVVFKEVAILRADALTPIVFQFAPPSPGETCQHLIKRRIVGWSVSIMASVGT